MTQTRFNFLKLWLADAAYAVASALSPGSALSAFQPCRVSGSVSSASHLQAEVYGMISAVNVPMTEKAVSAMAGVRFRCIIFICLANLNKLKPGR